MERDLYFKPKPLIEALREFKVSHGIDATFGTSMNLGENL